MEPTQKNHQESVEKATFAVQVEVQSKRHWNGTLTWVEKKQETKFQSVMEMLDTIEQVINNMREDPAKESAQ